MATEGVLTVEVEQIDVTSGLPYLDREWRFTDTNGHEHYFEGDGYPTLRYVVDSRDTYWCVDCHEEHEDVRSHYECPLCGATVVPGTKVDTHRRFMPGRKRYLLDGVGITPERYEEILAERRAGA